MLITYIFLQVNTSVDSAIETYILTPPPFGWGAMICICYFALLASILNAVCSLHAGLRVSLLVRLFACLFDCFFVCLFVWFDSLINLFDSARFCLAGKSVVDFRRFRTWWWWPQFNARGLYHSKLWRGLKFAGLYPVNWRV